MLPAISYDARSFREKVLIFVVGPFVNDEPDEHKEGEGIAIKGVGYHFNMKDGVV